MDQKIFSSCHFSSLFTWMLIIWFCHMNAVFAEDDLREIEPPFRNSGVGERQSAFRQALHEQLERLTHAELKSEQNSAENLGDHKEDEVQHYEEHTHEEQRTHEDHTQEEQNMEKHHGNLEQEKKRTNEHENKYHSVDGTDEDEEVEERTYDPWHDSFQDIFDDGTYAYGYNLPNGVTRYERSFYSEKYKGRVVEGFYTQPRHFGKRILYELRCYRSDYYSGYRPLGVKYLRRQPIVERDTEPDVDCFDER